MNPIDEAIREGLLENRIYSVSSGRFYLSRCHPRPVWTERKFAEMWSICQRKRHLFGWPSYFLTRSAWSMELEPHKELDQFLIQDFCAGILNDESQKNMTE